jgi:hypothetical protein
MRSIAYALTALPGFTPPKTYAAWPVWRDSTTAQVQFQRLPKKKATRLYHQARTFERQTRQPGRQDGAVGRNGLAVLHALIFDFLDNVTGQLDPSYAEIARKACISVRSAARGLAQLKLAGLLNWQRRSKPIVTEGDFLLKQDTNAYAVLPTSQWRGFFEWGQAPAPHPSTWGATPPLPPVMELAAVDLAAGASRRSVLGVLESDPGDGLAAALARLGRAMFSANP